MPLQPLPTIRSSVDALHLLTSLREVAGVRDIVRELERLVFFARGRYGPGYFEALPLRQALTARGYPDEFRLGSLESSLVRLRPMCPESNFLVPKAQPPVMQVGPVRFYQARQVFPPLQPTGEVPGSDSYGQFILPREWSHQLLYEKIRGQQGVHIGIGSLQNLSLAGVIEASGLLMVERDPLIAWTLPLILPLMPLGESPANFASWSKRLFKKGCSPDRFLSLVPSDYRETVRNFINQIRWETGLHSLLERAIDLFLEKQDSFLGDRNSYDHVARLVQEGAVAVIYGDFFDFEMPDLVYAALDSFPDPVIRSLYLSNALDYDQKSQAPLQQLLCGPWTDPRGHILMTTTPGSILPSGFPEGASGEDGLYDYRYHAFAIEEGARLLEAHGFLAKCSPRGRGISITV